MAPAVVQPDAGADVDERQVIVEGVLADRCEDPPRGDGAGDEQEPGESGEAEVAENPAVDPSADGGSQARSASGTGLWGSGPMYSDWGRMRRLLATCSRTWAVQPAAREEANVGVKYSLGSPIACSTPAE